jgi:predicted amidophosphoribosyltransferase
MRKTPPYACTWCTRQLVWDRFALCQECQAGYDKRMETCPHDGRTARPPGWTAPVIASPFPGRREAI